MALLGRGARGQAGKQLSGGSSRGPALAPPSPEPVRVRAEPLPSRSRAKHLPTLTAKPRLRELRRPCPRRLHALEAAAVAGVPLRDPSANRLPAIRANQNGHGSILPPPTTSGVKRNERHQSGLLRMSGPHPPPEAPKRLRCRFRKRRLTLSNACAHCHKSGRPKAPCGSFCPL